MRGLPFGITLFAPAHQDGPLLRLAGRMHRAADVPAGATGLPLAATSPFAPDPSFASPPFALSLSKGVHSLPSGQVRVAVCGAHMAGLPLNPQLTSRGGRFVAAVHSSPDYRLYALPGGPPFRPGMVRVNAGGAKVAMEIWELPLKEFGSFVAGIPAPLGIGTVKLDGGGSVLGFVCEAAAAEGAEDITALGSWRGYLQSRAA